MSARPGGPLQPPEGLLEGPVRSEPVFDGQIVRLRLSDYARDDGSVVRREVLDHHGAVVMVPLEDDHLLMVRQPREAVEEVMLELPAGKLDHAGEDPLQAARRELAEEVGREAGRWEYLGGFYTAPAMITEFIHLYVATELRPSDVQPVPGERIEVVRVPVRRVPELVDRVRDAKTLIGLMRLLLAHRL
ncbi:MAG TPA: NUDIX hydrolase [Miltoncostaeaceae bacterium]|nr:NUDIX hydrolase [Miltoncostaeaceae bacterium]